MKFIVEISDDVLEDYEGIDLMDALAEVIGHHTGAVSVKVKEIEGDE